MPIQVADSHQHTRKSKRFFASNNYRVFAEYHDVNQTASLDQKKKKSQNPSEPKKQFPQTQRSDSNQKNFYINARSEDI